MGYTQELAAGIASLCTDADTGARNVDNILTHSLLPELSGELLRRMASGEKCDEIHIYFDSDGKFAYDFRQEEHVPYTHAVREFGSSIPKYITEGLQPETEETGSRQFSNPETEDGDEPEISGFTDSDDMDDDPPEPGKKRRKWLEIFRR